MNCRILFLMVAIFITYRADAQFYVGIAGNLGNRITNSPTNPDGLLKRPMAPSASLIVLKQNRITNEWCWAYGISFGSLVCYVKALSYDSVSGIQASPPMSFPSYGTFYLSGNVKVGRHFQLDHRKVTVFLGGGLTVYRNWPEEGKFGKSPDVILFEYDMNRKDNKPKGFAEATIQTNITDRFVIGVRYLHHFNAALQGNYKFNQAKSSGQLSVSQRSIGIVFLVRVSST